MMARYSSDLTLTILGPFLTSGGGVESYGLDRTFRRNRHNRPVIPASHIKGKLRMAVEELETVVSSELKKALNLDIVDLFGKETGEGVYVPEAGMLRFTDLVCLGATPPQSVRMRVAIHHESGTAAENLLRSSEDLFRSGGQTTWRGKVSFVAVDDRRAGEILTILRLGISWLTNLGAEKGVGYGRLQRGWVASLVRHRPQSEDISALGTGSVMHLRIKALEPLMTGGVKKRRTNFVESEQVLTGGLIKGALAEALNREFGVQPVYGKLSAAVAETFQGFEDLAAYYDVIRISHGFPAPEGKARPVRIPLSTVKIGSVLMDVALEGEDALMEKALGRKHVPLVGGQAPVYQIDWKPSQFPYFDGATPKQIFSTRTEIDDVSQRALEGKLFTYSSICPEDKTGNPIEWVCNVDVSRIVEEDVRQRVKEQLAKALQSHLVRLGKQARRVAVTVHDGPAPAAVATKDLVDGGVILVVLQTDTLMLQPDSVRDLKPTETLHALYDAYWHDISVEGGQAALELDDFFACQTFQGGYLYHRYLGAVERSENPESYRPYYLTGAGSVFRLRVQDAEAARRCLARWQARGLPLMTWAQEEYGLGDHETWQACPFVPENGYGEIMVNMAWHWDGMAGVVAEALKSTGGGQ